jgi:hypothetical protein
MASAAEIKVHRRDMQQVGLACHVLLGVLACPEDIEPRSRLRRFQEDTLVGEAARYRFEPVPVLEDPDGRAGLWTLGVELSRYIDCRKGVLAALNRFSIRVRGQSFEQIAQQEAELALSLELPTQLDCQDQRTVILPSVTAMRVTEPEVLQSRLADCRASYEWLRLVGSGAMSLD